MSINSIQKHYSIKNESKMKNLKEKIEVLKSKLEKDDCYNRESKENDLYKLNLKLTRYTNLNSNSLNYTEINKLNSNLDLINQKIIEIEKSILQQENTFYNQKRRSLTVNSKDEINQILKKTKTFNRIQDNANTLNIGKLKINELIGFIQLKEGNFNYSSKLKLIEKIDQHSIDQIICASKKLIEEYETTYIKDKFEIEFKNLLTQISDGMRKYDFGEFEEENKNQSISSKDKLISLFYKVCSKINSNKNSIEKFINTKKAFIDVTIILS